MFIMVLLGGSEGNCAVRAHLYLTRGVFELQIKNYEKTECLDERRKLAKEVYDNFIMKEMLSHTHVSHPPPGLSSVHR